ncbi:MAG: MxaL protein, partial [Lysobacterales bacterium]
MKVPRRLAGLFNAQSRAIWAALTLLLLALVTPGAPLPRSTYNYIVVFDVTQSMNVKDYELDGVPVSRLAYTREAVRRALKNLPCGSRIGWGAFAEYRTILLLAPVEVCGNYDDLLASLDNLDGQIRWSNA